MFLISALHAISGFVVESQQVETTLHFWQLIPVAAVDDGLDGEGLEGERRVDGPVVALQEEVLAEGLELAPPAEAVPAPEGVVCNTRTLASYW